MSASWQADVPNLSPVQQRARSRQGRYAPLLRWPAAILDRPLRALPLVAQVVTKGWAVQSNKGM
jgi:hypothetical protein